jgi:membrane associated rhomboid family serine protease
VLTTSSQQHEWDVRGWVPDKPGLWDYGYVIKGQTFGAATPEELCKLLETRGGEISFMWTPETPQPVFPEEVPFLIDAFRRIQVKESRHAVLIGAALVAFGVVLAILFKDWKYLYRNFFVVLGAVALVEGIWSYSRARHYSQEDAAADASAVRFGAWLKNKSNSGYTFALAACICVVGVVQPFGENSIEVAGLVKPAVRNGEIWRLFTATLMHANLEHFAMNAFALVHFSKIIEHTLQRAFVPVVFLLTGAVGSVFSVLLYPNTTSVGASGGLMGLLGFITIAAYFDRAGYPPKYFRRSIEAIVFIGAFGLFGFAFIDNAAHLGGLVGGVLLGWLVFRRERQPQQALLKFGGVVAVLALAVVSAIAIYRLVG